MISEDEEREGERKADIQRVRVRVRRKVRNERRRSKVFRFLVLALLLGCMLACVGGGVFGTIEYRMLSATYETSKSLSDTGIQHLRTAESLLKIYQKNYFDDRPVKQAQREFASGLADFTQVQKSLRSLPAQAASIPVYGVRLRAALRLLPLVIELSQTGMISCDTLDLLVARFHNPVSNPDQGLTVADLAVVERNIHLIKTAFDQTVEQVGQVQPGDLQFAPGMTRFLDTFHKDVPAVQALLNTAERAFPVLPALLGVGKPSNYLFELLDSTELRPGGGFIGNYGVATVSGGRLISAQITDSYLLDKAYIAAGKSTPFPAAYSWFDLSPEGWSLRDSDLDTDFPTDARNAEYLYAREGGIIPLQGVIAITPAFIQQALEITGPIFVPEYQETVTAQNLIDRIHHYQLEVTDYGKGLAPSPDGHSSLRKRFTALLAEHFLARVHQLPSPQISKFLQMLVNEMHTKDVQFYFNQNTAQAFLQQLHLDGSIQSPKSDSLFVVDANISPSKANSLIANTLSDQVVIDAKGNVTHHTTLTYAWTKSGKLFGSPIYRDYVRVYVPPGSILRSQDGWQPRGTSVAFGREVWAGLFTVSLGQTGTITLVWSVPGAAKQDASGWHYRYLVQRQAGIEWQFFLRVAPPACAEVSSSLGGMKFGKEQLATLNQLLTRDINLGIDYTCR